MSTETPQKQVWTFPEDDDSERDAFIDEHYPERKMLSVPGAYKVPGGTLGVFLNRVTFYPRGYDKARA